MNPKESTEPMSIDYTPGPLLDAARNTPTALWNDSADPDELRTMLDFLLTARPPAPLPEDIAADLDPLLEAEAAERGMVDATEIPPLAITDHVPGLLGRNVAFWRGDLTRLRAGAAPPAAP